MAKIRASFVANSSSSSFLIIGVVEDAYKFFDKNPEKYTGRNLDSDYAYEIIEQYKEIVKPLEAVQICEDETEVYVGKRIFYTEGGGSFEIEAFEKKIADAKALIAEQGIEGAKVYFGVEYT